MRYHQTNISGLWLIEPDFCCDKRGYFFESYKPEEFTRQIGVAFHTVQENVSYSHRGVLRGLHLQRGDFAQAKLVHCIEGEVLDVALDLRVDSPSFGQHYMLRLSADNRRQLYIPRGFAHGFLTLSPSATIQYKVDNIYSPESEISLRYDAPDLAVDWRQGGVEVGEFILSDKDRNGLDLSEYKRRYLIDN